VFCAADAQGMNAVVNSSSNLLTRVWSLDLRSLALLRIMFGWILLLDLGVRAADLKAHYTDFGLAPRSAVTALDGHAGHFSLHFINGTWPFQALLFGLAALAALCLLVGYRTRVATFVSWLLLISLHTRNVMVLDGGDVYLRCVFFWCLFLPWGARWSIDSRNCGGDTSAHEYWGAANLGYRLQLSLIYWVAVALKSGAPWRCEGSAVYYTMMVDQLTTPLAALLLASPGLMQFLTFATLAWELFGPFLWWLPGRARLLGVLGFVAMHVGFATFLHLGVFGWIAASSSLGLLPAQFWDRLERTTLYRWLERQAGALSRRWKWDGVPPETVLPANPYLVGGFALYVVLWNLTTIPGIRLPLALSEHPGRLLRIDQKWSMFAPRPLTRDGWYVVEADCLDGRKIDLLRGGEPVRWDKPAHVASTYPNARWRKYMMNICQEELKDWRVYYGQYLTRWWNGSHDGNQRISGFRIYFMAEETLPNGATAPVQKVTLWTHRCF
jgi:hypothetical protein